MDTTSVIVILILGLFAAYMGYIWLGSRKALGQTPQLLLTQFPDLLQETSPVLIYCYGPNCSACRSMAPIIEVFQNRGQLVVRLDVSQHTQIAGELGVRAVPSYLILSKGKITHSAFGSKSQKQLEKLLQS